VGKLWEVSIEGYGTCTSADGEEYLGILTSNKYDLEGIFNEYANGGIKGLHQKHSVELFHSYLMK